MKTVTAVINSKALVHNLRHIRSLAPKSKLIAVVKANAYGHGLCQVADVLSGEADAFAVSRLGEALELRGHGVSKPIVLLEGVFNDSEVRILAEKDLYTAVHDRMQLEAIEKAQVAKPVHCWVQADIGMHRLGSSDLEEIGLIKERLEKSPNVVKPVGLISHLSVADTPSEAAYNEQQQDRFFEIAEKLGFSGELSLGNSAGIYECPRSHTDWVRPGIITYGISPFEDRTGADLGLVPAMTLESSLIAIHHLKKGDKVGYGAAWTAPRDTVLGVVACGYGDGYPRTAKLGTPVWVNGRRVPTAGNVCMDMLFVDLGPDSQDRLGDRVVLWWPELPVEEIARASGTIPYELVCRVMPRVNAEYQG